MVPDTWPKTGSLAIVFQPRTVASIVQRTRRTRRLESDDSLPVFAPMPNESSVRLGKLLKRPQKPEDETSRLHLL